ncbi:MAG: molybdenum cofactor guanylyltransferase [Acidobacteriota bacterium]|nr:molybdenum cofactor guanylyltransferase [Acidobacteriota bacterium]
MSHSGYVLAGGLSRRMGRDKARLPFRGATLVDAVTAAVRAAAGSATLVGRPAPGGIPDLYPGEGPLGGILTALHHSTAEWSLITACDLPGITPDLLSRLLAAARAAGDCDALLPHAPGGLPEPLCAVYRRTALPHLEERFLLGVRKVTLALEGLRVLHLEIGEREHFQNVNTPEDWAGYAAG